MKIVLIKYTNLFLVILMVFVLSNGLICFARSNPDILLSMGDDLIKKNDYSAALNCFDTVLEIEPENRKAIYNKALVLYYQSNHKDALNLLDKLIDISAFDREALFLKGLVLYETGKFNESLTTLEKLLAMDPDNLPARTAKCNVLRESGNKNEADKCLLNLKKR